MPFHCAPVMVLLVMGVLDLGRAYRMNIRLENAAREGAAYAQFYPNRFQCGGSDDIDGRVRAEDAGIVSMPGFSIRSYTADSTTPDPATCSTVPGAPGERRRIEVSADFVVLTPVVQEVV